MDPAFVLARLDALISEYEELSDRVFYLREEYLDGGRRRGASYEFEIRTTPPDENDDVMAMPLEDVKVGVKFAAFTRLDPLGRRRRYTRLSGAAVLARLRRLRTLAAHGRVQPPGRYAGLEHPTLRAASFPRIDVDDPEHVHPERPPVG